MLSDFEYFAIENYLAQLAIEWWSKQPENKTIATCDACSHNPIKRNSGYLIGSYLYCQDCFDRKAKLMLYKDPNSAGNGTIENALKLYNDKDRLEEKERIEVEIRNRNISLVKREEEKEYIINKRKNLKQCIYCGKSVNLYSRFLKPHLACNHIILSDGINGFFIDPRDGEVYRTAKIGDQIMMAENLRHKMSTGCFVIDNTEENVKKYGYLYDWKTAIETTKDLKGWHLPTIEEYEKLNNTFSDNYKNKVWGHNALRENHQSGFDSILCGAAISNNQFGLYGELALFWSSNKYNDSDAWAFSVARFADPKINNLRNITGLSVRLFHDL